jgi:hypothetical protein
MSEIDDIISAGRKIDQRRLSFVLEFIQNARRSGRVKDIGRGSDQEQNELVAAANALYDKAVESCTITEKAK